MGTAIWRAKIVLIVIHVARDESLLPTAQMAGPIVGQGWALLSQLPPFRYFPNLSALSKHTLDIKYHVYIWQVSPQLSCGDTCQIWMWFKESNSYFCKTENFAYKPTNGDLVTPTPGVLWTMLILGIPVWVKIGGNV